MPSLQIKTLISDISKNCNNLYADTLRLVSFVKCIFLQIIVFEIVLFNTFWRLWNIILEIVIHSYNKHYFVQIHLLLCWQFKSPSRNMKLVLLQQHEGGRCWSGKWVVFLKCSFFLSSDKTSEPLEICVLQVKSYCCCLLCVNSLLFDWGLTFGFWQAIRKNKVSGISQIKHEALYCSVIQSQRLKMISCLVSF